MLRPATPLTILLAGAFVLLLLSVLSAPVIHAIPLGSFKGINFGVFGYCKADGSCSPVQIGYDTTSLDASSFKLAAATRHTLSSILVIHPVAAGLTLVTLVLAITSHFHAPAHSVRYLLLVFLVSIFTFLATLLAFIVDVLLFIPHMAWGTYIVMAALILVALSTIVSCAMRRTLVGRKARQRRIAANAEMSGENYYNRQAQQDAAVVPKDATSAAAAVAAFAGPTAAAAAAASASDAASSNATRQPTLPLLGSSAGGPPSSFGGRSLDKKDDDINDEQIPLTSQAGQMPAQYSQPSLRREPSPGRALMSGAAGGPSPLRNQPPSVQRDQYGNPLPYGRGLSPPPGGYAGYDPRRGGPPDRMMNNSMLPPGQRGGGGGPGAVGYRGGRGGGGGPYGPPGGGRGGGGGGGGGYGPPMGRGGGYGPPGRGRGYYGGGPGGPGGRGGGYPGGPGPNRGQGPPLALGLGGPYSGDSGGSSGVRDLPPGQGTFYGTGSAPNKFGGSGGGGYEAYGSERSLSNNELPRAESPPPLPGMEDDSLMAGGAGGIGQAIEMDATTPRARVQQQRHSGRFNDTDSDIAGMVGLQQGRSSRHDTADRGQYVPVRSDWNSPGRPSPGGGGGVGAAAAAGGLAATPSPRPASEIYMEDVPARFAEQEQQQQQRRPQRQQAGGPGLASPYDDEPQGTRSPAESERSTFTSISQRGINPRWNPAPPLAPMPSGFAGGYGGGGGGGGGSPAPAMPRRAARDPNEALLNSNPDFSLGRRPPPGGGGRRLSGGGGGGGLIPGSAYPPM